MAPLNWRESQFPRQKPASGGPAQAQTPYTKSYVKHPFSFNDLHGFVNNSKGFEFFQKILFAC